MNDIIVVKWINVSSMGGGSTTNWVSHLVLFVSKNIFNVYLAYFKPAAFVSTFDSHKVQVTVGVVHCKQLALIEKVGLFNLILKLFYYVTSFMWLSTRCH